MITKEMVKPGATVIDVGINRVEGKLVGDVAEDVRDGGRAPHTRPGRRGADDDREPSAQHRARRALPVAAPCLPRRLTLR